TVSGTGWNSTAAQRDWTGTSGYNMSVGGTPFVPNIPSGPVGSLYPTDPAAGSPGTGTFLALGMPWHPDASNGMTTNYQNTGYTTGCAFNGTHNAVSDFNWMPMTDVYQNELDPALDTFLPVTEIAVAGVQRVAFS